MNKKILASALAAGLISISAGANAGVLNFDTLTGSVGGSPFSDYEGFLWSNFFALDPDSSPATYSGSGYSAGRVSEPNVAFNGVDPTTGVNQATVRRNGGGNFVFNGGYFSGAWRNGLEVTLEGLMGGQVTVSKTITVGITNLLAAHWFDFDWNIEELRIRAWRHEGEFRSAGDGTQFVLDNTSSSPTMASVPEPGAGAARHRSAAGTHLLLACGRLNGRRRRPRAPAVGAPFLACAGRGENSPSPTL